MTYIQRVAFFITVSIFFAAIVILLVRGNTASFGSDFKSILGDDSVFFGEDTDVISGVYTWLSNDENIIYLSSETLTLKIININGDLIRSIEPPLSDNDLKRIKDIEGFTDDSVTFIIGNDLMELNLSTNVIRTLYASPYGIRDSCWSNEGQSLYIVERTVNPGQTHVLNYVASTELWNQLDIETGRFFDSITCAKTSDKILIEASNSGIYTNNSGILDKQELNLDSIFSVSSLDQIPKSYFAVNSSFSNSSRHCFHFVDYENNMVYPLFGMYRGQRFDSLTYSSKHKILLVERLPYFSEHTKLYARGLTFTDGGLPLKETINCKL